MYKVSKTIIIITQSLSDARAVARQWRERRLPRVPNLRSTKKRIKKKLKNYQLNERKDFNTQLI
jgi:hypothetical protein